MISVRSGFRILVTTGLVDFRRGMDSLAMLVSETLRHDPFGGDLFVFRSKRADRIKILAWDGTGLVLYSKRLETGRFTWPAIQELHGLWNDRCGPAERRDFAGDSRDL